MIKKIFYVSFFFLAAHTAFSQTIETQTFSSASGFSSSNDRLSWTIGEPFIETLSSSSKGKLTQGFHQPTIIINGIKDNVPQLLISVFPNPTAENLTIKFENVEKDVLLEIFNTEGKQVYKEQLERRRIRKISF